ncbi:polyketide synthase [Candidatus Haliotispira prima]|uniref:Polyketide synthase n=1 Tax=Candidatus Haliotispira prima TaxID=3034016 RepID=A0ABY8MHL2_9SPIO|nr:polyketide synthase [Candidatus Haliotispira prima]
MIELIEKEAGYTIFRMDSTEGPNIFTEDFVRCFIGKWRYLCKELRPKVVVIQGRSDVFCAGGAKDTLIGLTKGRITVDDLIITDLMVAAPFPIIAAMEGHAMGGGLVMGAACDIVLAARESRYGAVFMNMGFTPGMATTTLLPQLMGPYVAAEMMYTGKRFKGSELAGKGSNINYILPKVEVLPKAEDIAAQMAEKPGESLYLLKHSLGAVKKKLVVEARLQEDLMHKISFHLPETQSIIREFYAGN